MNLEKEVVLPPKEVTLELPDGIYEKQDQILLAPTSKDWPRLKTTFQKQDLTELSRLFGEGVLSVPIGTKAKTIKKRNGVVLVEIIESGRQGWIGEEFVK